MQDESSQGEATQRAISDVFDLYDPPLWLLTVQAGEHRGGLIATFAVRASIVPELPRMVIGIAKHHHSWGLIETSRRFALHLLTTDGIDLVWRFGLQTGHEVDKFQGLAVDRSADGNPRCLDALSWLDCRVEDRMDIGDRTLYIAEVAGGGVLKRGRALTVGDLLRAATPERRAELERLYRADQAVDTAAILAWRRDRGIS
jgi:flavin reductase (DIM6/NTAB) family NADH-FMN oxidoreductase RutF